MGKRILKLIETAGISSFRIFEKDEPGPYFTGNGSTDLMCGRCAGVLAQNIDPKEIESRWFRCPTCKSINDPTSFFVPHDG
jgi:hypothetical protein